MSDELPGETPAAEAGIFIESGVSLFTGKPFCQVRVNGELLGQLTPDEVRTMALGWLGAAEAAEQDAVVAATLKEIGLDDETRGGFISEMRRRRTVQNDDEQ